MENKKYCDSCLYWKKLKSGTIHTPEGVKIAGTCASDDSEVAVSSIGHSCKNYKERTWHKTLTVGRVQED